MNATVNNPSHWMDTLIILDWARTMKFLQVSILRFRAYLPAMPIGLVMREID